MIDNLREFGGRHIIGPDTEVLGGVFFGSGAIVVDYEENPWPYEEGYALVEDFLGQRGVPSPMDIGMAAGDAVDQLMPFSEKNVCQVLSAQATARNLKRIEREDEVNLSLFMGGGICHHQTLFGGSLIRLLQDRRDVGGTVSVEMSPLVFVHEPERHTMAAVCEGRSSG